MVFRHVWESYKLIINNDHKKPKSAMDLNSDRYPQSEVEYLDFVCWCLEGIRLTERYDNIKADVLLLTSLHQMSMSNSFGWENFPKGQKNDEKAIHQWSSSSSPMHFFIHIVLLFEICK